MILPDPIIFSKPLHIWLGITTYSLIVFQILTGTHIVKTPLWVHTKVVWVIIIILASIHAFYGIQLYFF